jgi:hypothetical protein
MRHQACANEIVLNPKSSGMHQFQAHLMGRAMIVAATNIIARAAITAPRPAMNFSVDMIVIVILIYLT